jgi:hypothetical protein
MSHHERTILPSNQEQPPKTHFFNSAPSKASVTSTKHNTHISKNNHENHKKAFLQSYRKLLLISTNHDTHISQIDNAVEKENVVPPEKTGSPRSVQRKPIHGSESLLLAFLDTLKDQTRRL